MKLTVSNISVDSEKHRLSFWATWEENSVRISRGRADRVFPSVNVLRFITEDLYKAHLGFPLDFFVYINTLNIEKRESRPENRLFLMYYSRQNAGDGAKNNAYYRLKRVFEIETNFEFHKTIKIQNNYGEERDGEKELNSLRLGFTTPDNDSAVYEMIRVLDISRTSIDGFLFEPNEEASLKQTITKFLRSLFSRKKLK